MKCYYYLDKLGSMPHTAHCFSCNAPKMPQPVRGCPPHELSRVVPVAMPPNSLTLGGLWPGYDRFSNRRVEVGGRAWLATCDYD